MPERIQLSRAKGWRMPANTTKADRMPTGCELIWLLSVNARLGAQPQGW